MCREAGVPVWYGGMLETNVRRVAKTWPWPRCPTSCCPATSPPPHRHYHEDGVFLNFELNADSTVSVPQAPGLGVAVDRARLAAVTLHAETFRAPV